MHELILAICLVFASMVSVIALAVFFSHRLDAQDEKAKDYQRDNQASDSATRIQLSELHQRHERLLYEIKDVQQRISFLNRPKP